MWKTQCTLLSREKILILVPARPPSSVLKMAHCWSRDSGVEMNEIRALTHIFSHTLRNCRSSVSSWCEAEHVVLCHVACPPHHGTVPHLPGGEKPLMGPCPSRSVHRIHGVCELGSGNNCILVCVDFQLECRILFRYKCRQQRTRDICRTCYCFPQKSLMFSCRLAI